MGTTDVLLLAPTTRQRLGYLRSDLLEEAANETPQAGNQIDRPLNFQCGCSDSCSGSCKGDCAGTCYSHCENSCNGNCEGKCTNVIGWD
jgi:hypothetical protein